MRIPRTRTHTACIVWLCPSPIDYSIFHQMPTTTVVGWFSIQNKQHVCVIASTSSPFLQQNTLLWSKQMQEDLTFAVGTTLNCQLNLQIGRTIIIYLVSHSHNELLFSFSNWRANVSIGRCTDASETNDNYNELKANEIVLRSLLLLECRNKQSLSEWTSYSWDIRAYLGIRIDAENISFWMEQCCAAAVAVDWIFYSNVPCNGTAVAGWLEFYCGEN